MEECVCHFRQVPCRREPRILTKKTKQKLCQQPKFFPCVWRKPLLARSAAVDEPLNPAGRLLSEFRLTIPRVGMAILWREIGSFPSVWTSASCRTPKPGILQTVRLRVGIVVVTPHQLGRQIKAQVRLDLLAPRGGNSCRFRVIAPVRSGSPHLPEDGLGLGGLEIGGFASGQQVAG